MSFLTKAEMEAKGGIITETEDPRIFQTNWNPILDGIGQKCYYVFGGKDQKTMYGVPFETSSTEPTEAEQKLAFAKAQASADFYETEGSYPK